MGLSSFYEEQAIKQAQDKAQQITDLLYKEHKQDAMISFLKTIQEQTAASPMRYGERGLKVLRAMCNNNACELLTALTGLSLEELLEITAQKREGKKPHGN